MSITSKLGLTKPTLKELFDAAKAKYNKVGAQHEKNVVKARTDLELSVAANGALERLNVARDNALAMDEPEPPNYGVAKDKAGELNLNTGQSERNAQLSEKLLMNARHELDAAESAWVLGEHVTDCSLLVLALTKSNSVEAPSVIAARITARSAQYPRIVPFDHMGFIGLAFGPGALFDGWLGAVKEYISPKVQPKASGLVQVRFVKGSQSEGAFKGLSTYNTGEIAGFDAITARELIARGFCVAA